MWKPYGRVLVGSNVENIQQILPRNYGIVRENMVHCLLGKWWNRTAVMWSSCTLGLGPWTYHAPVLCLSVCLSTALSASCWLPVRLWSPRGKKSWPPPAGSRLDGPLSTSPCTAALPSGAFSLPLSLLFSLVYSHRYCLFLCCANTQVREQECTQCSEHHMQSKPQQTAGFHWCTHKQLEGRLICFCLEMKALHVIV